MFFFFVKSSLARERGVCSGNANAEGDALVFFRAHESLCREKFFFDAGYLSSLRTRHGVTDKISNCTCTGNKQLIYAFARRERERHIERERFAPTWLKKNLKIYPQTLLSFTPRRGAFLKQRKPRSLSEHRGDDDDDVDECNEYHRDRALFFCFRAMGVHRRRRSEERRPKKKKRGGEKNRRHPRKSFARSSSRAFGVQNAAETVSRAFNDNNREFGFGKKRTRRRRRRVFSSREKKNCCKEWWPGEKKSGRVEH